MGIPNSFSKFSIFVSLALSVALLIPLREVHAGCDEQAKDVALSARDIEIEGLLQEIETNYGPLQVKTETIGLDWKTVRAKFEKELKAAPDTKTFYLTVARLLGSFQDAHVSVQLPSSYRHSLPIQLLFVEGKTLVVGLAEDFEHSAEGKKIKSGDELISIDGKTPEAMRNELFPVSSVGNKTTNPILLSMVMTHPSEARGIELAVVSKRQSIVQFKRRETGAIYEVNLDWKVEGIPFISRSTTGLWGEKLALPSDVVVDFSRVFAKSSITARFNHILDAQNKLIQTYISPEQITSTLPESSFQIGSPEPFFDLPPNFKRIKVPFLLRPVVGTWVKNTGLFAGTFERDGKKVGFLRIPSYGVENLASSLFGLRYLIARLEKESDYLVIDQTNNPGGYVAFSDWLVFSLTGKFDEAKHMKFAVRPTQSFLRSFAELRETIAQDNEIFNPEVRDTLLKKLSDEYEKVFTAFKENKFISEPISLALMNEIMEATLSKNLSMILNEQAPILGRILKHFTKGIDLSQRQVFTKPVFMMINELDFSGGDATPAVLQDYGRVTLIGGNTAGAGGSVGAFSNSILNEFDFHLTNSLMIRTNPNRRYVENYGVRPEIDVCLTTADCANGFKDFFPRVLKVIDAKVANAH